jgi:hypothetical protein
LAVLAVAAEAHWLVLFHLQHPPIRMVWAQAALVALLVLAYQTAELVVLAAQV